MINNVRELTIDKCTGCSLCSQVCPFQAIEMVENNEGFIVPSVDPLKCKECGKCAKECPSIHPLEKRYPLQTILCLSKDTIIDKCASGGFFITIAKYFITELHGVVFGVIFDNKFTCLHTEAETIEQLLPMRNSKYVQSNVNDVYAKVRKRLQENRIVLFSGTPCQVAALKSYLGKDYCNLLTIDVVCHGVPNQKYWKKYIAHIKGNGTIQSYLFRNRGNKRTWNPASRVPQRGTLEATVVASWGEKRIPARKDCFYGPFVKNESFRESCYRCQYATQKRVSDITMGDCDSEKNYPDFYPYESKSIVLLNTDQGVSLWTRIQDRFESTSLDYEKEYIVNIPLNHPSTRPYRRDCIYQDLYNLPWWVFNIKYTDHITLRQILGQIKSKLIRTLNNG